MKKVYGNHLQHHQQLIIHRHLQKYSTTPIRYKQAQLITYLKQLDIQDAELEAQRIFYHDIEQYIHTNQYMKRIYRIQQFQDKISALSSYYKYTNYHKIFAENHIDQIMGYHHEGKIKMFRKMLNGKSQASESHQSSSNGSKNSQVQSKILDTPRSSIALNQICFFIDEALKDFQPKYYYKVNHQTKKELQNFKKFIKSKKYHYGEVQPGSKIHQQHKKQWRINKSRVLRKNVHSIKNNHPGVQISHTNSNKQNTQAINLRSDIQLIHSKPSKVAIGRRPSHRKYKVSMSHKTSTQKLKPKSFSKTTIANQTISRDEYAVHQPCNKRSQQNRRLDRSKSKSDLIKRSVSHKNKQVNRDGWGLNKGHLGLTKNSKDKDCQITKRLRRIQSCKFPHKTIQKTKVNFLPSILPKQNIFPQQKSRQRLMEKIHHTSGPSHPKISNTLKPSIITMKPMQLTTFKIQNLQKRINLRM